MKRPRLKDTIVLRCPNILMATALSEGAVAISALEALTLPEPMPVGYTLTDRECLPGFMLGFAPSSPIAVPLECLALVPPPDLALDLELGEPRTHSDYYGEGSEDEDADDDEADEAVAA